MWTARKRTARVLWQICTAPCILHYTAAEMEREITVTLETTVSESVSALKSEQADLLRDQITIVVPTLNEVQTFAAMLRRIERKLTA
jgi:hypothetical protein